MPSKYGDAPQLLDNFLIRWAERTIPSMAIDHIEISSPAHFSQWRERLKKKIWELLGEFPVPSELSPTICSVETTKDFIREKIIIETEKDCFMPFYLLTPHHNPGEKLPAILCCHGHGAHGKDPIAGVTFNQSSRITEIQRLNYNYGEQMAQHGYIALCPDWRGFGERGGYQNPFPGRDKCNVYLLEHLLLGRTLLGANIFDGMRAIDFLLTRKNVNPEKIGCMGLSFGGTMTTYLTLLDDRIKAADIICYATTTLHYSFYTANTCGSQLVPSLYQYADIGDVIGAIAPRPLLVESGASDTCFWFHSAQKAHSTIAHAYQVAEAIDALTIEIFPGEHSFSGNKAFDFFEKHLKCL
ncbi:MAG: alpha/beta hydrolase family protein [Candidatus Ratteibacteria bacterium]|jgi:dienelactone hydrolase